MRFPNGPDGYELTSSHGCVSLLLPSIFMRSDLLFRLSSTGSSQACWYWFKTFLSAPHLRRPKDWDYQTWWCYWFKIFLELHQCSLCLLYLILSCFSLIVGHRVLGQDAGGVGRARPPELANRQWWSATDSFQCVSVWKGTGQIKPGFFILGSTHNGFWKTKTCTCSPRLCVVLINLKLRNL